MIPKDISKLDVLNAIEEIDRNGIPNNRQSRKYHLLYNGKFYPPKLVISIANKYKNGFELAPNSFGGGMETNSFLENLGFAITNDINKNIAQNITPQTVKRNKHTERCKACKIIFQRFLNELFTDVNKNYQIPISTSLEDFSSHKYYKDLVLIYKKICKYRNHADFIITNKLPKVDFFIGSDKRIVEFDESQHFTEARKISLENYPKDWDIGFNREKWISLCEKYNSKDNSPIYRDEQRAWYDTLRDFVPGILGLNPTIRVHATDEKWCALDPENKSDQKVFLQYFIKTQKEPTQEFCVRIIQSNDLEIGVITITFDWSSDLNEAKNILYKTYDFFPKNTRLKFLITPGAFTGFTIPDYLHHKINNKEPSVDFQKELFSIAENECRLLLEDDLRNKLIKCTRYISIGVDSFKEKISKTNVSIKKPHAELVCLYDLQEDKYFWTGKSFPTSLQEKGLIRITNLNSHFINSPFGQIMILGCHDLNIYSNRGKATTKSEWRKKIREDFKNTAEKHQPEFVLHHPHTTDSTQTWKLSWKELERALPSVRTYAGSGIYYNQEIIQRSDLDDVLRVNRKGNILHIIIERK